jgi:hypothetical protein
MPISNLDPDSDPDKGLGFSKFSLLKQQDKGPPSYRLFNPARLAALLAYIFRADLVKSRKWRLSQFDSLATAKNVSDVEKMFCMTQKIFLIPEKMFSSNEKII